MKKLAVVALGGNTIIRNNQNDSFADQERNTFKTLENLVYLVREGYHLIITHGNGPQVGNILMRNDAGENLYNITQMPLEVCVADSQGGIGFLIEKQLRNVFRKHQIDKDILTIGSQILVDRNDPAFENPQKRIGRIYTKDEADQLSKQKGWQFKPTPKQKDGFQRVVSSPKPIKMFNSQSIKQLALSGAIVITAGGGGVPVYQNENRELYGSSAVIDKDLASAFLAHQINADELYILTDVPYVYINFNTPQQQVKEFLNLHDALEFYRAGMFGEGSMGPKILAAIEFIENGGKKAIITEATQLENKDFGTKITLHYSDEDLAKEQLRNSYNKK